MNTIFIDCKMLFLQDEKSLQISNMLIFRILYWILRFRLRENYFYY